MFDRVLSAPLVFCGIAILRITFEEGVLKFWFCIKIVRYVSTMLLPELSDRQFFGNIPVIFRMDTFQNSERLFQISFTRNYYYVSTFLVQVLLKSTFTWSFARFSASFINEKLSRDLEIT